MKLEALLVTFVAVGCGSVDNPGEEMMNHSDDTEAPLVVDSDPVPSAVGVGAGATIHITFSEPMDNATVLAAYSSTDLPIDKVSTSWNDDNTVLTISPDEDLLYAEGIGNDPTATPRRTYSLSIGPNAADLAGNPLGSAYELSFKTKVRMATTAAYVDNLTGFTLGGSSLSGASMPIGDASLQNYPYRGYVTFDLSLLPAGVSVESAEFSARQTGIEGMPYGLMGALNAYHLSFSTMTNVGDVPAISFPGIFSSDGTAESKSIDVTSQVEDDLAKRVERANHTQYRLQFESVAANGAYDRATFATNTFEMNVTYIAD